MFNLFLHILDEGLCWLEAWEIVCWDSDSRVL